MNKNRRGAVLTRPFTENNTKSSNFNLFKMRNIGQFSNDNSKFSNNNSGITLIALVVSIVVLLILAGVSINLVSGGDGIISKASKAVDETVKASMKEQIEMYVSEATYDYYLNNPDNKSYLEFMGEYLENNPNMRSNENVDIVVQDDAEVILNYTQGKNVVQMSLSSDGIVDVVGSGTTEGGIEDTYAPKISYASSTTSSITVTMKDASGVVAYACLTSSTKPEADSAEWVTIAEAQTKQVTITGLTGNQTYYVFAKDKAGNISDGKVCKTIDYEEIKFTTVQSGSNFTVTVTAPTDTSNIVYQIGDDGTETQYAGAFLVPSGKTVYIWNVENKNATKKSKALFANVTVTYDANGGEGELPENVVTQHKQTVTVDTSKVLTKTGYTFLGWALTDDATEGIDTFEAPATNTTLYAVWEEDGVKVKIIGSIEENITITKNGETYDTVQTDSNGEISNVSLPIGILTFSGSVSNYNKEIEITKDTTEVKVMPKGALYWYGNQCEWITGGWSTWIRFPQSNTGSVVFNKNNVTITSIGGPNVGKGIYTNNTIKFSDYNKILWRKESWANTNTNTTYAGYDMSLYTWDGSSYTSNIPISSIDHISLQGWTRSPSLNNGATIYYETEARTTIKDIQQIYDGYKLCLGGDSYNQVLTCITLLANEENQSW